MVDNRTINAAAASINIHSKCLPYLLNQRIFSRGHLYPHDRVQIIVLFFLGEITLSAKFIYHKSTVEKWGMERNNLTEFINPLTLGIASEPARRVLWPSTFTLSQTTTYLPL